MKIPSSSLEGWFEATCCLLEPLYDASKAQVLASSYLQVDETPIPVVDKQKKGETHRGYHWVYHGVETKLVLFDYGPQIKSSDLRSRRKRPGRAYGTVEKLPWLPTNRWVWGIRAVLIKAGYCAGKLYGPCP